MYKKLKIMINDLVDQIPEKHIRYSLFNKSEIKQEYIDQVKNNDYECMFNYLHSLNINTNSLLKLIIKTRLRKEGEM
jgi:hypothetical protein